MREAQRASGCLVGDSSKPRTEKPAMLHATKKTKRGGQSLGQNPKKERKKIIKQTFLECFAIRFRFMQELQCLSEDIVNRG